MKSSKVKEIAEIVSIVIAIATSLGFGIFENIYFRIALIAALVAVIGVFIFYVMKRKKQEKLTSNVGLTKEADRVCKKIDLIIKKNIKSFNKYNNLTKEEIYNYEVKEITNKLDGDYSNKSLQERKNERIEIYEYMFATILDMDRILLLSEQYDYRIKFGKFIAQYSNNEMQIQKAYIDLIGWTYVIMGRSKTAQEYINKGIEIIDSYLTNPHVTDKEKYDGMLKKIRAYRHLGSDHSLYTKKPLECLKYLDEGLKLMEDEAFKEYYLNNEKQKYEEMNAGLNYGVAICNLYLFKTKNKGVVDKYQLVSYLKESIRIINLYKGVSKTFSNKHRYTKFLLLENSVYKEIKKLDSDFVKDLNHDNIDFNKNIKEVESLLNTSLYADEAMIYYLEQKLDSIIEEVNNKLR